MTDAIQRSAHAAMLLEDKMLTDVLARIEADAVDRMVYAQATDDETRAACATQVRALRALRAQLKAIADDGKAKPPHRVVA